MPFCPNCGSQVDGRFCTKCGRPMDAGAGAGAPAAGPTPPPLSQQPPAPAKKKSNVLVWVLVGIAGIFLLIGLVVIAGGLFLVHKAKQAGLDPDLLKSNPAMAAGKFITAMNPNLDVVDVDEGKGVIVVRDKKTGKRMTLNFEDAKRGKIVFAEEGKGAVTMEANGEAGGLNIHSSQGDVHIGSGAGKAPSWIPVYPGAAAQGSFTSQGGEGDKGTLTFTTDDSVDKVAQYYETSLKSAGFKVTSNMMQQNGSTSGGLIEAGDGRRTVNVVVGSGSKGTSIAVTYGTKP